MATPLGVELVARLVEVARQLVDTPPPLLTVAQFPLVIAQLARACFSSPPNRAGIHREARLGEPLAEAGAGQRSNVTGLLAPGSDLSTAGRVHMAR